MATFEILPEQVEGTHNPYKVLIGHDSSYGTEIDNGEVQYRGRALITPPAVELSDEFIEDISADTSVNLLDRFSTQEGTVIRFEWSREESWDVGDMGVKEAFTMLIDYLGTTSIEGFKAYWDKY